MKVSVAGKHLKGGIVFTLIVLFVIEIITLVAGLTFFFGDAPAAIKEPETYIPVIIAFVVMVIATVILFVILAFNVAIDENGITLYWGVKAVRHISWEEAIAVETYEIPGIPVWFRYKFLRVSTAMGVNIRFGYDEQALELIKQYYKRDIISR